MIFLLRLAKWEINVVEDWLKIKSKRKCVIIAKEDEVISEEASLYNAIRNETTTKVYKKNCKHNGSYDINELKEILSGK